MVQSRLLAVLAAVLALAAWAACAASPTDSAGVRGRYALRQVGGIPVPYGSAPHDPAGPLVPPTGVACEDSTFSQTLDLRVGGTLNLDTEQATYCNDGRAPQRHDASRPGSFSSAGDSVFLSVRLTDGSDLGAVRMSGVRAGDTLRFLEPVRTVDAPDGNGQTLATLYVRVR